MSSIWTEFTPSRTRCSRSSGALVAAAVVANGGRILMEKATIPGVGDLIFFQDPEGNVAGAMRYDPGAD